jgi:prepilin-type N-terminal cleavage/methylation domain-containing protein
MGSRQPKRSVFEMSFPHRRAGFSLIELLMVIAIVIVVNDIAVPQCNRILMSARETRAAAWRGRSFRQ